MRRRVPKKKRPGGRWMQQVAGHVEAKAASSPSMRAAGEGYAVPITAITEPPRKRAARGRSDLSFRRDYNRATGIKFATGPPPGRVGTNLHCSLTLPRRQLTGERP